MSRTRYRVTPTGTGDWRVARDGAERADSIHPNKVDAVSRGRDLARSQALGQLIVHNQDGKIQTEHTYGSDPEKYPG